MIKGEAQLIISPAMVIAMAQEWFDRRLSSIDGQIIVTMVHPITEDGKWVESYKVSLREPDPK